MSPVVVTEAEEQRYAELQAQALDCARSGDTELLGAMLAAGMPVNLADHRGNTLLMLAAYHEQTDVVRLLLERGAQVDRRNDRHQTPLGGVAFKGSTPIARLLIDAGADVNADNGNGLTPLMFARLFGRHEVASLLESAGANPRARSRFGLSIPLAIGLAGAFRALAAPIRWLHRRTFNRPPRVVTGRG